eukprot:scaffold1954_cov268-Pinguiococcus_pyrenoidosus.AAC.131
MTAQKQSSSERRRARDRERKRREYQANREQINKRWVCARGWGDLRRARANATECATDAARTTRGTTPAQSGARRVEERGESEAEEQRIRPLQGASLALPPCQGGRGASNAASNALHWRAEAKVLRRTSVSIRETPRVSAEHFSDPLQGCGLADVYCDARAFRWTTFEVLEDFGPLGGPGSNYQQSRKELDEDKRCLFGEFLRAEGPSSVAKKRHRPLPEAQIRKEECVKPETQQANERQDGIVVKLKAPLNGTGDCVPAKDRRIAPGAELSVDAQETSEQRRKRLARERQRRHRAKRSLMKQSSQPIVHMAPGDLALDRFVNTSGRRTEASGTMPDASGSMSPRKASSIAPDAESTSDAEEFAAAIMASLFWANFSASH